jgi:outer membrane usher protein
VYVDPACLYGPAPAFMPPLAAPAAAEASSQDSSKRYEEIFVAVSVNGRAITQFADVLRTKKGQYLVTAEVLHDARLVPPPAPTATVNGQPYYAVESLPGTHFRFDEDQQVLLVQSIPENFEPTTIDYNIHHRYLPPNPPSYGLFLNHDMSLVRTSSEQLSSGLFQTVLFNPLGVLTSNMASTNLLSTQQLQRLDTNFTREMPGSRRILTIGDTLSAGNSWAESVHYAGVQFASDFAIQPSFIPFMLPSMRGQAAEPSTVNIYMNNVLSMHETVDTGPFTLQNIPVMTQEGDMQMVVTDTTGHQQVVTRSYIASNQLLRRGVSSYTYESGIMRWGEGTTADNYHSLFAEGTQRYGLRDNLTLDFRGEALASGQTVSAGMEWGRLRLGLLSGNVAVSRSAAGVGKLAYLLMQHQTHIWTMAGTAQMATPSFRQLGLVPGELAPRLQAQGQLGRNLGRSANLALGYLLRECQGIVMCTSQTQHLSAATASAQKRLWRWGSLAASATYSPAVQKGASFVLTLSIPMDHRRSLVSTAELSGASQSNLVEFQQSLPNGDGYGYRARFNTADTDVAGEAQASNHYGTYSLASERSGLGTEWSAEERSSLVLIGNQVRPTRWINDSFALVDVPGQSGIRVYANNQYITKTDKQGVAIVPLVPFDSNVVRLDDKDVPVQLTMDLGEHTVVPYSRTGMLVRFHAEETNGATLILHAADDTPLPLGSMVIVPGATEESMVAYDGEVFIMNLPTPVQLHVRGEKFECDVSVPKAPAGVSLPRIGPLLCKTK